MLISDFPQRMAAPVYYGKKTKLLARQIPKNAIALLDHADIDEMAAIALIAGKVKAVLNCAPSMTGKYASLGTLRLKEANIPVYDLVDTSLVPLLQPGDVLIIKENEAWLQKEKATYFFSPLMPYTASIIEEKLKMAEANLMESLRLFTENTLHHALKEMQEILKPMAIPNLRVQLKDRQVVVVTRGRGYYEDLLALKPYIDEQHPIMIGVDGGADAILECGYFPDLIIGDMDSVSLEALRSGAELVVHAYPNGEAPGLKRIQEAQLTAHLFPCFGTSEDAAYLLAYQAGASLIVSLGSHTSMIDFLEKGRKGMGSTLLVRLKIGEKLIDAKGVRHLYPERRKRSWIRLASSFPHTMKQSE